MSANKQHQKELKQPDQLQREAYKLSDWLVKNQGKVKKVVIPIIILVVAGIGYSEFERYQADGRRAELAKVDIVYNEEMEAAQKIRTDLQDQVSKLSQQKLELAETKDKTAKASTAKVKLDPKKIAADIEAAEKKLADVKADHSKSETQYLEFFKKNQSNPQGWRSGLRYVQISLENKNFKQAASVVERVLAKTKGITFYQVQVRMLHVSVLEELAKYDEALKEVDQLMKLATEDLKPQVLLMKGRIQILQNHKPEAYATFKGLISKHGSSSEAGKAKTIMALWN